MKKTFSLANPKIQYALQIDGVKHDVRKYLKRERRKPLPENVDFWDFDCKFGPAAESSTVVHVEELTKRLDEAQVQKLDTVYIEILAKPGHRAKKPTPATTESAKASD